MTDLPRITSVSASGATDDSVTLSYDARFIRRKTITTDGGQKILVDLAKTTSLNAGDVLLPEEGPGIVVRAAEEPLYHVSGDNPARLAWHIGNRHTPCQFEELGLLIQRDPVIKHMLEHLGAHVHEVTAPFTPEGGAYGQGRTLPHEHGATAHAH